MSIPFQGKMIQDPGLFNAPPMPASELVGLTGWINGPPLTLAELRGQVILLEFWTLGCVNCLRTLPYVRNWYEKYKDQGFVVLGIHRPEFDYEADPANVQKAVTDRKLTYPIALDNQGATWDAYQNRYWPAQYLIDKHGQVRSIHFGEGAYDMTEAAIQALLAEPA